MVRVLDVTLGGLLAWLEGIDELGVASVRACLDTNTLMPLVHRPECEDWRLSIRIALSIRGDVIPAPSDSA